MQLQVSEIMELITKTLSIHLNVGQNIVVNTSSVFITIETAPHTSLENKTIESIGSSRIHLPDSIHLSNYSGDSISIRVCFLLLINPNRLMNCAYENKITVFLSLLSNRWQLMEVIRLLKQILIFQQLYH